MDTSLLIPELNNTFGLELTGKPGEEALQSALAEKIDAMIRHDFGGLVQLLYRTDIDEMRLRRLLDENRGEDAGMIISALIIGRQWQKIETRMKYRNDKSAPPADEEEKW